MRRFLVSTLTLLAICSCSTWAAAGNDPAASSQSQFHRPDASHAGRASLLVAGDMAADQGVGLSVDYDIPLIAEAGPGRLLLGPSAFALFATDNDAERLGCDVTHREQVFAGTANLRYVLDIHEKLRPWANMGLGIYFVQHSYDRDEPCAWDVEETDSEIAPGLALGLGVDLDLTPSSLVTFGLGTHSGEDDFATVSIGLGWRF